MTCMRAECSDSLSLEPWMPSSTIIKMHSVLDKQSNIQGRPLFCLALFGRTSTLRSTVHFYSLHIALHFHRWRRTLLSVLLDLSYIRCIQQPVQDHVLDIHLVSPSTHTPKTMQSPIFPTFIVCCPTTVYSRTKHLAVKNESLRVDES
jgi:hypothetical protein